MCFFCFKQKTAYEMRISDWSSDGCSSDLGQAALLESMAGDSEIAERAVKVRIAADRCAKIVKTFLSMARQRPADRRPIHINRLVEEVLDLVTHQLSTTDVLVTCDRSEEHTSELQSLMRSSYAVFCLKKKNTH